MEDSNTRPSAPPRNRPPAIDDDLLAEVRGIRLALVKLTEVLDAFAGVFLNTRFPHGKPTDRWGRRRG